MNQSVHRRGSAREFRCEGGRWRYLIRKWNFTPIDPETDDRDRF